MNIYVRYMGETNFDEIIGGFVCKRGTLMMENLTQAETRIGHNRLKLVGTENFMDG